MNSFTTRRFREMLDRLPAEVQKLARKQYALFEHDPGYPSLEFKQVRRNPPTFSARVGLDYRVVARQDGDDMIWYWIGPHHEYDRLLKQL